MVPVARELGMVVTFADLHFPKVGKSFDDNGNLLDDSHIKRIDKSFKELIWMAKTMKHGRENISKGSID